MASNAPLDSIRPFIKAAGGMSILFVVCAFFYARPNGTVVFRFAGVFLGAIGTVAYLKTRDLESDSAHPIPFDETDRIWTLGDVDELPQTGSQCAPYSPTLVDPTLAFSRGSVSVNGIASPDPWPMLDNQRSLWTTLHPRKDFPGVLAMAAPTDVPARFVMPYVEQAHDRGYPYTFAVVARRHPPFESATLGQIQRQPRVCFAPILPGATGPWSDHIVFP